METSPGFCGTKGSVWLESVLWRRISVVCGIFSVEKKRRLYLRGRGKQTDGAGLRGYRGKPGNCQACLPLPRRGAAFCAPTLTRMGVAHRGAGGRGVHVVEGVC